MKRVLICIRSFNDFDQALPIIDYIVNVSKNTVSIWSFEEKLDGCQDHLKYLNNNLGLQVENLYENLSKISKNILRLHSFLAKISSKSTKYPLLIPITILVSKTRTIFNYFFRIGYSKLFRQYSFDVIMVDTGMDSTIHGQNILLSAKEQDICSIGYAHGYSIYSNYNSVQKGKVRHGKMKSLVLKLAKPTIKRSIYADYYLTAKGQVFAQFKKSHASGHYSPSELYRVREIGMPRYTYEWNKKYRENVLNNQTFSYGNDGKLNVVLFMSHPQYNVIVDNLYLLIDKLFSLSNINFVYKPHTRKGLHLINSKYLKGFDASEVSSVLLSEWADIGIVYGSSIGFQLLIDNVPLIIPTFVHSNKTIFENDGVSVVVNSIGKFTELMSKSKPEIENMVDKNKVNDFMLSTIYGFDKGNMMKNYCSFLKI